MQLQHDRIIPHRAEKSLRSKDEYKNAIQLLLVLSLLLQAPLNTCGRKLIRPLVADVVRALSAILLLHMS